MELSEIATLIFGHPLESVAAGLILGTICIKKLQLPLWDWIMARIKSGLDAFGKALNASTNARIDALATQMEALERSYGDVNAKLDAHIITADRNWAEGERQHILDFSTGLSNGTHYDHEAYRQVLASIDKYTAYCRSHPEYPNSMAVAAIEHIRRSYQDSLET